MKLTLKNIRLVVSISRGNNKLGFTPNISLPPIEACLPGVLCADEGCYALLYYRWPSVKQAWDKNLNTHRADPKLYFQAIDRWLEIKRPYYFRWHVAGDILSQQYLDCMIEIAWRHSTRFLVYTKQHGLDFSGLPENLTVVFSMWPGIEAVETDMPLAWVADERENRIPVGAFKCIEACPVCGFRCWYMGCGESVVFKKK
jgi:hypothetical protein